MMTNLKDKVVCITGASSGIGRSCVIAFAKLGAKLILCARRLGHLDALANEIRKNYDTKSLTIKLDVSDTAAVSDAFQSLAPEFKDVDVLVNNAGVALGLERLDLGTPEDWWTMIDVNLKGVLAVTHALLPQMVERNSGHVIFIGSTAGHGVYPGGTVYCSVKHAIKAVNKGLKVDMHGLPIRVTSIDPGMVKTEFSLVRFKGDAKKAGDVYAGVQTLLPDDIADAVVYSATRPKHINISEMIVMPTYQSAPHMAVPSK